MAEFTPPADLVFNDGPIHDPVSYADEVGCASWLCLTGPEFAATEGGLSYAAVAAAVPQSVNVVTDPPRVLNLDLARQHVAALDALPRPTVVTCRTGPRASAVVYMYAGLRSGASPGDVLAAVARDHAPCAGLEDCTTWIAESMVALRGAD